MNNNNNNNSGMPELIAPQYTHSLKLEETAKGLRISVHCYANTTEDAIQETFRTYLKARQEAIDNKIQLAPMNGTS